MKKQFLTLILSITVLSACLSGCGSAPASDNAVSETTDTGDSAVAVPETDPDASAESAPDNNASETTDGQKPADPATDSEESSDLSLIHI